MDPITLLEEILDLSEAKLGQDGVIKNVHFVGFQSKNSTIKNKPPYKYSSVALKEATDQGLYNGLDIYLSHGDGTAKDRDPKDKIGVTSNARFDEAKGVKGDLELNPAHPYYPSVKWWADNKPDRIAMSHRATCALNEATNEVVIIKKVKSLDIVSNGATTTGLFTEGVIGDKIALIDDNERLYSIMSTALGLFDTARYPLGQTLTPGETALKCLSVAKDLVSELSKFNNNPIQESNDMDITALNLDELKKSRPDLVTLIMEEAVETERKLVTELEEAVKDLPMEARTKPFMRILRNAKKAGEDIGELVTDRKSIMKEVTESVSVSDESNSVVAQQKKKAAAAVTQNKPITDEDILKALPRK